MNKERRKAKRYDVVSVEPVHKLALFWFVLVILIGASPAQGTALRPGANDGPTPVNVLNLNFLAARSGR